MSEEEANVGEGLGKGPGFSLSRGVLQNLADGLLVVRVSDLTILQVNPAFGRIVRHRPEDLIGQHLDIISVDPSSWQRLIEQLQAKAIDETPWTQQIKLRRSDDESCWVRARTTRYEDPEQGPVWVSLHQDLTDERRMIARLEEQERLLSQVWEQFPISLVQFDREGGVHRANAAAATLWPWAAPVGEDGTLRMRMWWPDGTPIPPAESPLARALGGETTRGKVLRFRTPDHELLSGRITAIPLSDPAGNPDGALVFTEDLTEQEHELALQRELLARTGEAILVLDANRGIRYANETAQALLLGAAIPLDLPVGTFVTGESLESFSAAHQAVLRDGGKTEVHRLELTAASGHSFLAEVRFVRIEGIMGTHPMVGVLARNIELTETHLLDQRLLAEAGELLSTSLDPEETLEHLVQLLFAVGADCFCVDLSEDGGKARRRKVGAVQRHLEPLLATLGRPMSAEASQLARQALEEETLLSSATYPTRALEVLFPDPTDRKVAETMGIQGWIVVPLIARGRRLGLVTVLLFQVQEDRTRQEYLLRNLAARAALAMENARLFSEAQAATVSREQLLRVVAHDLRTPLQSVRLASELTLRKLNNGLMPAAGPVEAIGRAALRMDRLIGDLVDWARIGTGSLSVELAPIDVPSLLDEVMETVRPSIAQHRLERRVLPRIPEVMGDRMRLIQVLVNLVSNALKFTPPGGRVTLAATATSGGVIFSVDDEGPGLDAEQQARIFEPFTQLTSGDRRGLGLGLTISQGLVEAQGSHIEVRSNPGHGSRFYFVLPLAPE